MAVLLARHDQIAVGGDRRLLRRIGARAAELPVVDKRAFAIELGDVGVGAAGAGLPRGEHAGDLAADIDVA